MFLEAWKPAASAVFISPELLLGQCIQKGYPSLLVTVVDRTQVENPLSHFSLRSYCSWAFCCLPPQNPVTTDGSEVTVQFRHVPFSLSRGAHEP